MTTEIQTFSLSPSTFEQAMQYAKLIADSDFAPKDFKGKPSNVLIAIQMGSEVGLKPMQAIQNIAVINGRPSLWGDAMLALVKCHPEFEDIDETIINDVASCTIKRKGQSPQTRTFSLENAKKAGLAEKPGPWTQYRSRMLQLRARAFAIRDVFPDAIKGLSSAEEVQDTPYADYEVVQDKAPRNALSLSNETNPELLESLLTKIKNSETLEDLRVAYNSAKSDVKDDKEAINKLAFAAKERKEYLKKCDELMATEQKPEPVKEVDDFVKAYEDHVPTGEK